MARRQRTSASSSTVRRAPDRSAWLAGALLLGLTILAYIPALGAGYVWDDDDYVLNNPTLRSAAGLVDIWFRPSQLPQYYPLVHTTYWIEYHLWSLWWPGYHAVNVLLHAVSAIVLYRLLTRLALPGAWLIAAIFAVHPVHVESVAWITERKNTLSLLFYLLSLGAYLRAARLGADDAAPSSDAPTGAMNWRWYGVSLALFVCALLSKTVTSSLPAAVLLLIYWQRGRIKWKRDVRPLVPFFAVGLAMATVTGLVERHVVGASGDEWSLSLAQRTLIAGQAVWFYFGKLIWPTNLSFIYPRWDMSTDGLFTINPQSWHWAYPIAAVVVVAVCYALRRRLGRGPLVAVLFFGGTLLPALGFVNVYPMRYSFVADHFQYHASIGMIALAGATIALLASRQAQRERAMKIVAVVLLAPLVVLTFRQSRYYDDWETLFLDTLSKNPNSWMVHANLGHAAREAGRMEQARSYYAKALELAPNLAESHLNWGLILLDEKRYAEAADAFDRATQLNARYANAHFLKGTALYETGQMESAIESFRAAVATDPTYARAWYWLGVASRQTGRTVEAEQAYRESLKHVELPEAHTDLAGLLMLSGRLDEAIEHYNRALSLNPQLTPAQAGLRRALMLKQSGR